MLEYYDDMVAFEAYQTFTPLTVSTDSGIETSEGALSYRLFGLIGEAAELYEKVESVGTLDSDIDKEAGDFFWYLSETCNYLSIPAVIIFGGAETLAPSIHECNDPSVLLLALGRLAESSKKYLRDNTDMASNRRLLARLQKNLSEVLAYVLFLLSISTKTPVEQVLELNKDKLLARKEAGTLRGDGDNR